MAAHQHKTRARGKRGQKKPPVPSKMTAKRARRMAVVSEGDDVEDSSIPTAEAFLKDLNAKGGLDGFTTEEKEGFKNMSMVKKRHKDRCSTYFEATAME